MFGGRNCKTVYNQSQKLWEFLLGRFGFSRVSVKDGCWFIRAEYLWGGSDYPKALPRWYKFSSISNKDAVLFCARCHWKGGFLTRLHSWGTGSWFLWRSLWRLLFCTLLTLKYVITWSAVLIWKKLPLFSLLAAYLEGLRAAFCSKSSPNALFFEDNTFVCGSCSAFLFLIVGPFLFAINDLLKALYSL